MKRLVVTIALAGAAVVATAGSASAGFAWNEFHAAIEVRSDGTFEVIETIRVDFLVPHHGIFRDIHEKYEYDDEHLRDYDFAVHSVTRDGHAEPYEALHRGEQGEVFQLKIGDPDVEIDGSHEYVVRYTVAGAMNSQPTHGELYWNITGSEGPASFAKATASVTGPEIVKWACFTGPQYATEPCAEEAAGPERVRYSATDVGSGSDFTVVVGFSLGTVTIPAPDLHEIWSGGKMFAATAPNVGLATVLSLGSGALLVGLLRRGRDERGTGGLHETAGGDLLLGTTDVDPDEAPVQFRPPKGLKPAHLGLIDDEKVDPVDAGATIVDLAVRGHVLIEDRRGAGDDDPDWVLTLRVGANPDDQLEPFEQRLVDGLQSRASGGEVRLADVKGEFHSDFGAVADLLYADSVDRGWFRGRPDRVRLLYLVLAFVPLGLATAVGLVANGLRLKIGLAIVPLALFGLALLATHRRMPAKTARGRATLAYARGFKKFIETAEKPEMNYAVEKGEFLKYLPYAVAFDAVEAWSRATKGLDVATATSGWYVGPHFTSWGTFGNGFSSFASSVGTGLASAPSSSGGSGFSGGFSGGGGGGGGTGGW